MCVHVCVYVCVYVSLYQTICPTSLCLILSLWQLKLQVDAST